MVVEKPYVDFCNFFRMATWQKDFTVKLSLQCTLDNSNTRNLELFDISNKPFGPLAISHSFGQKNSRFLEHSISRTSRYLEQIFQSLGTFISLSRTFVKTFDENSKIEFSKVCFVLIFYRACSFPNHGACKANT